jgi:hypothetical protein
MAALAAEKHLLGVKRERTDIPMTQRKRRAFGV